MLERHYAHVMQMMAIMEIAVNFRTEDGKLRYGLATENPVLTALEALYISAETDDAIRPQWEQWAAREYLHVEPVVIKGAGHATIILNQVSEVVDAATQGL